MNTFSFCEKVGLKGATYNFIDMRNDEYENLLFFYVFIGSLYYIHIIQIDTKHNQDYFTFAHLTIKTLICL